MASSDESDSDSDSSDDEIAPVKADEEEVMVDEEDPGPSATTSSYFTTKNEVVDPSIVFPDIQEVGPDEYLELVGQVLNIIDNVVIIEGLRTELARGGSDRALDADTLLVFEDRKVLGYVSFPVSCDLRTALKLTLRYTKRLVPQHNPCIRSNFTRQHTL